MDVYLVDGTYELFRHFFALPPHVTREGREVSAARGALGYLLSFLESGVTHLGVATDQVIESFRNEMWAAYKTGEGVDQRLLGQFPLLEEGMSALGIANWPMKELEADDGLAAVAAFADASPEVEHVYVCSPDKDLAQCVRDERVVQVIDRRNGKMRDEAGVIERFGVAPKSIPDYLALVGDSADGYPGLPGWGAKSAAALLAKYRHIESIPPRAGEWQVSVRSADKLAVDSDREPRSRAAVPRPGDAAYPQARARVDRGAALARPDAGARRVQRVRRDAGAAAARPEPGPPRALAVVREVVVFVLAFSFVFGIRRFIWRLNDRGIVVEDLFGGEKLVSCMRATLKIEDKSAYGVIALTDMRIVWAPIEPAGFRSIASAMNPDAIAITLGEIRHARSTWNPLRATLRLETPNGVFVLSSANGSFGAWLRYISENARNLLKTGEPVTLLRDHAGFTEHALAKARGGTVAGTLALGAIMLANLLSGGVLLGSNTLSVLLAFVTVVSFIAAIYLMRRHHDTP